MHRNRSNINKISAHTRRHSDNPNSQLNTGTNIDRTVFFRDRFHKSRQDTSSQTAFYYEDFHQKVPGTDYMVITKPAGKGFKHAVTDREIKDRINCLPASILKRVNDRLAAVQLCTMTRTKMNFYGTQYGDAVLLYPMQEPGNDGKIVTTHNWKILDIEYRELRHFGAKVEALQATSDGRPQTRISWSQRAVTDFYLENILLHELGHLLDPKRDSNGDRENYANHFASLHRRNFISARPARKRHNNT